MMRPSRPCCWPTGSVFDLHTVSGGGLEESEGQEEATEADRLPLDAGAAGNAILATIYLIDAYAHEADTERVRSALDHSEGLLAVALMGLHSRRLQIIYGGGRASAGLVKSDAAGRGEVPPGTTRPFPLAARYVAGVPTARGCPGGRRRRSARAHNALARRRTPRYAGFRPERTGRAGFSRGSSRIGPHKNGDPAAVARPAPRRSRWLWTGELIMNNGVVVGVAVGVGYLLGRTRKLKLVMTLAAARASGRLGKRPAGLVKQGTKVLGSSPELKTLTDTVRGRLLEAGKAAAVRAASSQIDALSDRLQERTRSLSRPSMPTRGADKAAEEGRSDRVEAYDEEEGYDEEPVEDQREERLRRRPASARERPRPQHRGRETEPEDEDESERPRRTRPTGRPPVRRTWR
jgi:hypothetical protein